MTSQRKVGILQPAICLTVAIAVGWIVAFWPARMLGNESAVFWMSMAAATCLVPGWIVLALGRFSIFPNDLSAMVVQTMVRLCFVAGVAVIVRKQQPQLGIADFFGWLIGFYLLALLVEVLLLQRAVKRSSDSGED